MPKDMVTVTCQRIDGEWVAEVAIDKDAPLGTDPTGEYYMAVTEAADGVASALDDWTEAIHG